MKRYQLAVAAKETEYMRRLADYVRGSSFGERWMVSAFTNVAACRRYVSQGCAIDMLVAEPDMLEQLRDELPHVPYATLVGRIGEGGGNNELLQYQALPLLLKGITELHGQLAGARAPIGGRSAGRAAAVVAVCSASGGVGKTALSVHMAHAAGVQGMRVFYLNLERWNTSGTWLGCDSEALSGGPGLSEFLYAVKAQPQHAEGWFSANRKYDAMLKADYLPGFANMEDRMTLSAEDAVAMTSLIAESGQYDVVVIDMDDGGTGMHIALLELADRSYQLVTPDLSVLDKQRLFFQYADQKWGDSFRRLLNKAELVCNRSDGTAGANDLPRFVVPYAPVRLPEVAEWGSRQGGELLSSAAFRAAAFGLLKHALGGGSSERDRDGDRGACVHAV